MTKFDLLALVLISELNEEILKNYLEKIEKHKTENFNFHQYQVFLNDDVIDLSNVLAKTNAPSSDFKLQNIFHLKLNWESLKIDFLRKFFQKNENNIEPIFKEIC